MKKNPYIEHRRLGEFPLERGKPSLLGTLDIELTERCNNNCIHCYINLPANELDTKKKELSTGEIKNTLIEAVSLGCMTVRFTGGEPLLREDFKELYVFARKLGLKVLIFTNATLISPSLAELFAHIPPLEEIEITVYGMKESSYEAVTRVPGSFQESQRGIKLLLEKKIPFIVKGVAFPFNKEEMEEFEKWTKTIPWMNQEPPSYAVFFNLHSRRDEKKNELIKKFRPSPEEGMEIFARRKDKYIAEMKKFCLRFIGPSGDKLFSCGSGRGCGCLDAYGYFQPCLTLRHPDTLYDLKTGSLKDALTNFFPKLRQTKATNPQYLRRCAKCFLKGLCEQCPAMSWMEHGTLDTPVEYLCEVAHVQGRFLGLVRENEKAWEVKDRLRRVRALLH